MDLDRYHYQQEDTNAYCDKLFSFHVNAAFIIIEYSLIEYLNTS